MSAARGGRRRPAGGAGDLGGRRRPEGMEGRRRLEGGVAAEKASGRGLGGRAERSAYFARRESAKILRSVLQGDARRQAVASIKTLVYGPSVRNKRATFALVCQTLKCLPLIKEVLAATDAIKGKWKRQVELLYVIAYDILFGQDITSVGAAEKFLLLRKSALQAALAKLCVREKVKTVEELLHKHCQPQDAVGPRHVRVNLLKTDIESAIQELSKTYLVIKDDTVPDLLVLPSGTDLHDHPLVRNGSIFLQVALSLYTRLHDDSFWLQGKASCMVAVALGPEPGWEVLDACSAPGNKTVHLAALMKGKGKVIACELNEGRIKILQDTIIRSGATNIEVLHGDFLSLDSSDPAYSKVRAILLDPSCSGSGTGTKRLDFLLPSHTTGVADNERLQKLSTFQRKALAHALSFPSVQKVVYSTCSVHQVEDEDVVQSVLPLAGSLGFQLAAPFPQWELRGLPVFEGSEKVLRTDLAKDMEGFFIALFERKSVGNGPEIPLLNNVEESISCRLVNSPELKSIEVRDERILGHPKRRILKKKKFLIPHRLSKMSRMLFYQSLFQRTRKNELL